MPVDSRPPYADPISVQAGSRHKASCASGRTSRLVPAATLPPAGKAFRHGMRAAPSPAFAFAHGQRRCPLVVSALWFGLRIHTNAHASWRGAAAAGEDRAAIAVDVRQRTGPAAAAAAACSPAAAANHTGRCCQLPSFLSGTPQCPSSCQKKRKKEKKRVRKKRVQS